jgi:hypothetical protein
MQARIKRLVLANGASMALQLILLALLSACGLDTWLAVGISKGASWSMFAVQLCIAR